MGLTAPPAITTIHWTQFPATAIDTQWDNPHTAHRAIMNLFPRHLPGEPEQRRAANGILYRADNLGGEKTILIQSLIAPSHLPEGARTLTVSPQSWAFAPDDRVMFRVAVNPIRRHSDGTGSKKRIHGVIPSKDVPAWFADKLGDAVTGLEIVNHYRDETGPHTPQDPLGRRPRRDNNGNTVTVDVLECLGNVNNIDTFDSIRVSGLGRAKAYGCGLLTARHINA